MKASLFLLALLSCLSAFAGDGQWSKNFPLNTVQNSAFFSIADRLQASAESHVYAKYEGYAFLEYTRKNHTELTLANEWKLVVDYRYFQANGTPVTGQLKISNSSEGYVYADYAAIPADVNLAKGYEIQVMNVTGAYRTGTGSWTNVTAPQTDTHFPADIQLRLELRTTRWLPLTATGTNAELVRLAFDPASYRIRWSYLEGAESYDLEWVHYDSESHEYGELASIFASPALLTAQGYAKPFEWKEPARVRLRGTHYAIDPAFTSGTLYFRVRAVTEFVADTGPSGQVRTGAWTYFYLPAQAQGTINAASIVRYEITTANAFEKDKNWTYGVAYAEDGKSVSNTAFYDGSHRGRQSLVYNTSDNVTLISESKSDYEGRQAISVIPAPVRGKKLGYHPLFNIAADGSSFDENDFDFQVADYNVPNPATTAAPMSYPTNGESGAAKYFSANNTFDDDLFRAAIPEANGYVYSQTIYRNDGTGRIERIGGIGPDFKATGLHAVQTFYGSPTTLELKRLFGENIGSEGGYRKEMVRDANGQYSVTYFDKRGHTIATGLAGNAPTNLLPLAGQGDSVLVTPLNDNNQVVNPYESISEHTLLNTVENNAITLTYELHGIINQLFTQPVTIGQQTIDFGNLCSTCRYDLRIEVVDAYGAHPGDTAYTYSIDPEQLCSPNAAAGVDSLISISMVLPHIGEYRIVKTLTVDTESMEADFNNQLETLGLTDVTNFIAMYVKNLDLSACFNNCQDYCTAMAKLDYENLHGPDSWDVLSAPARQQLIDDCLQLSCDPADFYADFADTAGQDTLETIDYCSSIRERMIAQISPGGFLYDTPNSPFWGQIGNGAVINGHTVTLDTLQNPATYTREMAEALLIYHREYCHLAYCGTTVDYQRFGNQLTTLLQQTPWNAASAAYTAPYDLPIAGNTDPFLTSVFNTITPNLQSRVMNYITQQSISASSLCPSATFANNGLSAYVAASVDCIAAAYLAQMPSVTLSAAEKNRIAVLLFNGLYNQLKENMVREYKTAHSCNAYTDADAIFPVALTQAEMQAQIASAVASVLNQSSCETKAFLHTQHWISQLPVNALAGMTAYDPAYTLSDLNANLHPGNLEQQFFAYSLATCATNPWGWFYNPGSGNPGYSNYLAIQTLLTSASAWPVGFEMPTPNAPVSSPVPSFIFSECFLHFVELMNTGIDAHHAAVANNTAIVVPGFETYILMPVAPPQFAGFCNHCNNPGGTLRVAEATSIGGGLALVFSNPNSSSCSPNLKLKALGGQLGIPVADIDHLENPVWHTSYSYEVANTPIGSTPPVITITFPNIVILDAVMLDGSIQKGYIYGAEFSCGSLGSFVTPSLPDFDSLPPSLPDYVQDCFDSELAQAKIDARDIYNELLAGLRNDFEVSMATCISTVDEDFQLSYHLKEYQYTLYYYDLAGNLIQTVPPQGVDVLGSAAANANAQPVHRMETRYAYNGLNSLISQFTPDGGQSTMYYDQLYRVRFSQNAQQAIDNKASYSKYDRLGRVTEAGELQLIAQTMAYLVARIELADFPADLGDLNYKKLDYTKTYYEETYTTDATIAAQFSGGQQNLRNAIGAIVHRQADYTAAGVASNEVVTVLSYSYDPHKNVKQLVSTNQQLAPLGQQHKKVLYSYDLISGNVNEVSYQPEQADAFRYRYHYDANNRLVRAYTSTQGICWELDAKYFYYLHGPLARKELGHDQVQGTDYAYNLQGWLKGANSATLTAARDLGKDGNTSGMNPYFGVDAFGFQLGYFSGDYASILPTTAFAGTGALTTLNGANGSLYNGNIPEMVTAIRKTDESVLDILGNTYKYDQLQRIREYTPYYAAGLGTNNNFSGAALYRAAGGQGAFQEKYTYDKNGNLLTLQRNGSGKNTAQATVALPMDNFNYQYVGSADDDEPEEYNKLRSVTDAVTSSPYETDIQPGQAYSNYVYNSNGQLTTDLQEDIEKIEWTVTGKVKKITFTTTGHLAGKHDMKFIYDPMDRRVAKVEYVNAADTKVKYTYYSYDASGNVLATYARNIAVVSTNNYVDNFTLNEHHLYGSDRIGVENSGFLMTKRTFATTGNVETGTATNTVLTPYTADHTLRLVSDKRYELSNHLGNVLAVITDRKVKLGSVYSADVVSFSDYSPFGVVLDNRKINEDAYRYGFQGQEKDDEVKGKNNSVNYEYRMHDPRVGRFFAVDPLAGKYPHNSPYAFSENRVLDGVELEGLEVSLFKDNNGNLSEKALGPIPASQVQEYANQNNLIYLGYYTVTGENRNYYNGDGSPREFNQGASALVIPASEPENKVLKAATASMVWVIGNDVSGVGVVDDFLIPVAEGLIASALIYNFVEGVMTNDPQDIVLPIPSTYPIADSKTDDIAIPQTADPKNTITLYRGIGVDRPTALALAKQGIVLPIGGHDNPDLHNWGDNESIFTSWTMQLSTAQRFANFAGPGGVVLQKEFKIGEFLPSIDGMKEGEYLVPGPVYGATPLQY